jgi:hypothetical protein
VLVSRFRQAYTRCVALRLGRPANAAFAVGLMALFCSGAAVAKPSAESPPTVTIDGRPKFSGTWHEGWFAVWRQRVVHRFGRSDVVWKRTRYGSLIVVGTVSDAAQLKVTLRSSSGKVISASKPFSVSGGRYRASLKLGRPLPGPYTVATRVVGPSNTTLKQVHKQVKFPPPPEGVADRATISATRRGRSVKFLHNRHVVWARFHFLTLPPATRMVWIEWRRPDWVHVCQTPTGPDEDCRLRKSPISADGNVTTFLRSPTEPLQTGRWYCQMSVKHGNRFIVARRTFVTIR